MRTTDGSSRVIQDETTVIVGAGPYGLAAAAHLGGAGVPTRVFGRAMSFWDEQMPVGMLLRSPYVASNIADPAGALNLDNYGAALGRTVDRPVPLDTFVAYGRWFQEQAVPDVDPREVREINSDGGRLRVTLRDGDELSPKRVIVATGVGGYPRTPQEFDHLPSSLASHASTHRDLSGFAGRDVVVIGGGQSALETAALLHEAGARTEIMVRGSVVHWLRKRPWAHSLGPITKLAYAPAEVGPPVLSRLVEAPRLFSRLPRRTYDRFFLRCLRPAGAAWLRPRVLGEVPLTLERRVVAARAVGEGVCLTLDDGSERRADHIILATGYEVDVDRCAVLGQDVKAQLRRVGKYPALTTGFESSVAGLHFLGAMSSGTFGPLMRFVAGTTFTGRELTHGISRESRAGLPLRAPATAAA